MSVIPTTFEFLCFRAKCASSSNAVLLIYRTGAITSLFFEELVRVLDCAATYAVPLLVAGDLNIHVERSDDVNSRKLLDTMSTYGLSCQVMQPTHNLGGTLDVLFSYTSHPIAVTVTDPRLSDHFLLQWKSNLPLPPLVYVTTSYRPWHRLNVDSFRAHLMNSALCCPELWLDLDIEELADMYDVTITSIIDELVPQKTSRCPRRQSSPWYDDDCRRLKQFVRRLERYLSRCILQPPDLLRLWKDNIRIYHQLVRQKKSTYWSTRISDKQHSPRELWQSLNTLMCRNRPSPPQSISAEEFLVFFLDKVFFVRHNTTLADSPAFSECPADCELAEFPQVSEADVFKFLQRLPNKYSACDPIPTSLLKCCADILTPYLTSLLNMSFSSGVVPTPWKNAFIKPVLKKSATDYLDVSSYRPISNLPALSKVAEKIVSSHLHRHISDHCLLPTLQSAYRTGFSTETAVLKVTSDALMTLDKGQVCLMTFLDLSSAFDCVEHATLLQRLHLSVGLQGTVLSWFESYLASRKMVAVQLRNTKSMPMTSGVPQGSVLGPVLFSLYIADIVKLVRCHSLDVHIFADDILINGSAAVEDATSLSAKVSRCYGEVKKWLATNGLHLNSEKTKVMWCQSPRARNRVTMEVTLDGLLFQSVNKVKYLGVTLDAGLSFSSNVSQTASACFSMLRRIRSVKGSVSRSLLVSLINTLVFSRLDYCLSLHAGLPKSTIWRLQRIIHASARLVFGVGRFEHITPLLKELGWLSIRQRIDLRLGILAYKCYKGMAPSYLSDQLVETTAVPDAFF